MECPKCNIQMRRSVRGKSLVVETCPQCMGLWLSKESMKVLIDKDDKLDLEIIDRFLNPVGDVTFTDLNCPSCIDEHLVSRRFKRLNFEQCPKWRGVFLEAGRMSSLFDSSQPTSKDKDRGVDAVGEIVGLLAAIWLDGK